MKEFISNNLKVIITCMCFIVTMYVQHVSNTSNIQNLSQRCDILEQRIHDQYDRIDAIKLDKSVFEATMKQVVTLKEDVREIRNDVKELLKAK